MTETKLTPFQQELYDAADLWMNRAQDYVETEYSQLALKHFVAARKAFLELVARAHEIPPHKGWTCPRGHHYDFPAYGYGPVTDFKAAPYCKKCKEYYEK